MPCYEKATIKNIPAIPVKNIQKLMIEFYRYLCGHCAPVMNEVFTKRILKYNPRSCRSNYFSKI